MLTFCLPLFAFDHHYLTRFKTSQGRMRSLRPGPPLPSAPAPLVHAQSIWNVHVETIKGSQMAELAENAMKHIRPGPIWNANIIVSMAKHRLRPCSVTVPLKTFHISPECSAPGCEEKKKDALPNILDGVPWLFTMNHETGSALQVWFV